MIGGTCANNFNKRLVQGVSKVNSGAELIEQVRQLIMAENEGGESGRVKADFILAQNFTTITRSNGDEEDRAALLNAIANPRNQNLSRELDEREFWVVESNNLGVVRSLITTKGRSEPSTILGRFRNIHVFEKQQGRWRCVAWQVTRLKESPSTGS